jgi:predicted CoA-binding protein
MRRKIDDFLAQKRIAVVGVSRQSNDFSRTLFRDLRSRGYDAVPVNPDATEIEGLRSWPRVSSIEPPVDAVLVMTLPAVTESVVHDCAQAGITRIWLYRGVGTGAVSQRAVEYCKAAGIAVIPGFCPYMFFPKAGFPHNLHGFLMKLTGGYPAR